MSEQTTPVTATNNSATASPTQTEDILAIASVIIGVLGLCSFFISYFSLPLSVIGLVTGYLGQKSKMYPQLGRTGMIISAISLVIAIAYILLMFLLMGVMFAGMFAAEGML
jgi:hypothetical protein